jgi:hypothetical protein
MDMLGQQDYSFSYGQMIILQIDFKVDVSFSAYK